MNNESEFVKRTKAAAEEAAENVVATARQYGTPIIVWSNGEKVEIDPYNMIHIPSGECEPRRTTLAILNFLATHLGRRSSAAS